MVLSLTACTRDHSNAQADGQERVAFRGHTTITAQAVIPEGMALAGTVITVRGDYSVGDFEVNDAVYARNTISATINQDTFIRYIQDIN